MKKLLILILIFIITKGQAQDIHFTQWYNTPMLTNPANTGVFDGYQRVIVNYKNQWPNFNNAYRTIGATYDMPIFLGSKYRKKQGSKLGVGLNLFADRAGDASLSTYQAQLSMSSVVRIARHHTLSVGLIGGIGYKTIDLTNLFLENQYAGSSGLQGAIDPNEGIQNTMYIDAGVGAYWEFSPKYRAMGSGNDLMFNFGAAVFHPHTPVAGLLADGDDKLMMKIVGTFKMRYDFLNGRQSIIPMVMYSQQGPNMEANTGLLYRFRIRDGNRTTLFYAEQAFGFGFNYRFKDAISPLLQYEINNWVLGLSYDVNVSSLTPASGAKGGFELCLKYANFNGGELYKRRANSSKIRSPKF